MSHAHFSRPRQSATTIAVMAAALWSLSALPAAAIEPPAVARAVEPSLVRIIVETDGGAAGSIGSGIVINASGQVVTNYHVVAQHIEYGWQMVVVTSGADGGERHPATVAASWPGEDLAVLDVVGLNRPPVTLSPGDIDYPSQGTTLFAFGYPGVASSIGGAEISSFTVGMANRLFDGAWTADGPRIRIIQHSATTNPGNSGGPIVNPCGQVVGINTERELAMLLGPGGIPILLDVIQGVYFASHISVLAARLDEAGIAYVSTPKQCRVILGIATTNFELYAAAAAVLVAAVLVLVLFIAIRIRRAPMHVVVLDGLLPWRHRRHPQVWHLSYTDDHGKPVDIVIRRKNLTDHSKGLMIGCGPDCDCHVDKKGIGVHHAKLVPLGDDLAITAVDADCATSVDDRPLRPDDAPVPLRHGSRLKLGETQFKVR